MDEVEAEELLDTLTVAVIVSPNCKSLLDPLTCRAEEVSVSRAREFGIVPPFLSHLMPWGKRGCPENAISRVRLSPSCKTVKSERGTNIAAGSERRRWRK